MSRLLHRWIALPATVLVLVLMLSGAALSLFPALESAQSPPTPPGMSVAELASRVKAALPEVQQIKRAPSGRITAYYFAGLTPAARVIDPARARFSAMPPPRRRRTGWSNCTGRSCWARPGASRQVSARG